VLALCMLAGVGRQAVAQGASKTPTKSMGAAAPTRTTLTVGGAYTTEQASRGRYVYGTSCRGCHTAESHTGAVFAKWWKGKQLSDLYSFVLQNMPKNDPGTLAPEDAADVVAYLLKMNTMPAGHTELPPDVDELKKIRIEVRKSGAMKVEKPTATRTQP
jgi:mono/diheme cytochrome c family protein